MRQSQSREELAGYETPLGDLTHQQTRNPSLVEKSAKSFSSKIQNED
jgi:hypothetical protein